MKTWKTIALALSLAAGTTAFAPSAFACDCKDRGEECHCKDCGKEGHACKHGKAKGKSKGGEEAKKDEAAPAK